MKVSAICPVFNTRPDLLQTAVESVLAQEGGTLHEVILIDDGSKRADTLAALKALQAMDSRIVVLQGHRNTGPAGARNRGLARATGDWIAFIDADDLWPPGKLARARRVLLEAPGAVWIGSGAATLGIDGAMQPGRGLSCIPSKTLQPGALATLGTPALTRCIILEGMHLGANLIRPDVIQAAGGFNPAIAYGEDWNLLAVISLQARMHYVADAGYVLRRQFASMMWSSGRMSNRYASGQKAAVRDVRLKGFRREARWALYRVYKDIALNNASNGRRLQGLWFALWALSVDPREVREFALFASVIAQLPFRRTAKSRLSAYSNSEVVKLSDLKK